VYHADPDAGTAPAGGRQVEVRDPALALQPVLDVRQRDGGVDLLPVPPEAAEDADLVEPQRAQPTPAGHHRGRGDACGVHRHPLSAPDMKPRTIAIKGSNEPKVIENKKAA